MASDIKTADVGQEPHDVADNKSIDKAQVSNIGFGELPPLLRGLSAEELEDCEKKLRRKIDLRLLPTLIIIYIMNYLDRS